MDPEAGRLRGRKRPGAGVSKHPAPTADGWNRAVRLTARASAVLFSVAQLSAGAGPRAARIGRAAYLGFMAAHAVHFVVVARYAVVNQGRRLFPGGRNLSEAGGWPTVLGIFSAFAGLAFTGWVGRRPGVGVRPARRPEGRVATSVIAALFVGTYLGQLRRSRWNALPAALVAGATTAGWALQRRTDRSRLHTPTAGRDSAVAATAAPGEAGNSVAC